MFDHAADIIPLLLWLVVVIGGALLALVVWIGKRLQDNVDKLPGMVTAKVTDMHKEIVRSIERVYDNQRELERDLRDGMAALDRRVTTIETRCDIWMGGRK